MFESPLISSSILTFLLIIAAEMGDKSQIVCMTLAAKHRAKPVLFGAMVAFMLLNFLAVLLGASLASYIPMYVVSAIATIMFTAFGVQALLCSEQQHSDDPEPKMSRSIFFSALSIILVAEMGDKTQLAVATLSTTESPLMVWLSASLALLTTSAVGVYFGKKWLAKLNLRTIHKVSGVLFLIFAVLAAIKFIESV